MRCWSVVVWRTASQGCTVTAGSREAAERAAIEGFNDGIVIFDEPEWGDVEAGAEPLPMEPALHRRCSTAACNCDCCHACGEWMP